MSARPDEEGTMGANGILRIGRLCLALTASMAASGTMAAEADQSAYQGAWLAQGLDCAKIYSSSGKSTSFRKPADLFAPAFIIFGKRLTTPQASCRIKSMRPVADQQVLLLDCANAVSGHDVSVRMAAMTDGTLRRYFNDQDLTGTTYQRCPR
jgi:hypothetical protein